MTQKENAIKVLKHEIPEWLPELDVCIEQLISPVIERQAGFDAFGVQWTDCGDTGGGCHYTPNQKPIISDMEKWKEEVHFPDLDAMDWDDIAAKEAQRPVKDALKMVTILMGPFERTTSLMSFEDCLVNYLLYPDEMYELIGAIADYKIDLINRIVKYMKPDVICLHDDWGTESNLFMDINTWRKILKPHTKRMYDAVKAHGLFLMHHGCGRIQELLGDMIEMGVDAWDSIQACNDLAWVKKTYGKQLTLHGRVDHRHFLVDEDKMTDEQIRTFVHNALSVLVEGGGYIGSGMVRNTSERYKKIFREEFDKFHDYYKK